MAKMKTFETWLADVDPNLRPLAEGLRQMVLEAGPDLTEGIKWGNPVFEKKGKVFYIASMGDRYISLGLWNGASLSNPQDLIEGTGKRMRHIKIRNADEMSAGRLGPLIREAISLDESDPA